MPHKTKLYYNLLEIIEKQEDMIKKQNELITRNIYIETHKDN